MAVHNPPASSCGMDFAVDVISQKWNVTIILELVNGMFNEKKSLSYSELQVLIPTISTKVLSTRIKFLVDSGIVERIENPRAPKKVRYKLTEAGSALIPILNLLREWSIRFGDTGDHLCRSSNCRHAVSLKSVINLL